MQVARFLERGLVVGLGGDRERLPKTTPQTQRARDVGRNTCAEHFMMILEISVHLAKTSDSIGTP